MKKLFVLFAAIFMLLLAPAAQASTSAEATSLANVLHNNPASGYDTPYGSDLFPTEEVNPLNGGLTLSATDLYLPGKNGLDLELKRIFNSINMGSDYSYGSSLYTDDFLVPAFKYTYTISGKSYSTYIMFDSETQMLMDAPKEFYSTEELLGKTKSQDDNGVYFFVYSGISDVDGDIKLSRDLSAAGKDLVFSEQTRITYNCYETLNTINRIWNYSLPYVYHESTVNATNEYLGYGMYMDYDGESHILQTDYSREKIDGVYVYSGGISVSDSAGVTGAIEEGMYNNEPSLDYFFWIKDNVGRTMYFNRAGRIKAIEDRFGNNIRYYYNDGNKLSKIIDTLNRVVTFSYSSDYNITTIEVDVDNDGISDKKIVYTNNLQNNDELDPNSYLLSDNTGTFKVSIFDEEGKAYDTIYEYRRSDIVYRSNSTESCIIPHYIITKIIFPNGMETEYSYSLHKMKNHQYMYSIANRVSKKAYIDQSNNNEYNVISYDYGSSTITYPTVTELNESKNLKTTYNLTLESPSHINKKIVRYDTGTYSESYEYVSSVTKARKMNLLELTQNKGSQFATSYYNIIDYTYSTNRIKSQTQNDTETVNYTYYPSTGFVKTKVYSVSDNRYIKEEYILNDEVDGDRFKNRNVVRINVYESTDDEDTYVLKETTSFTYDSYGNMSSQTLDPDGQSITSTLSYSYENGNIITQYNSPSLVNADGTAVSSVTTSSVTDSFGHNISSTDGNGNTSTNAYDFLGRITSAVDALGNSDEYEYDIVNRTLIHTAKNGQKTKVVYDGFGNVLKVYKMYNNAYRLASEYVYDSACRPVTAIEYVTYSGSTCTQKLTTAYTWTKDDRVLTQVTTDISGNVVDDKTYSYQYVKALGTTDELTDHDAINKDYRSLFCAITLTQPTKDGITPPTVTEYYDIKGRLVKRKTVDGNNTYFYTCIYDHLDRVTEEKDEYAYLYENSLDFSTKTVYDYKGRAVEVYNAEGNCTTYTYNSVGNLVSETDPMGNTKTYTYDGLGRMLTKSVPFTSTQTSVTKYYYDGNGNVTKSTIPSASRTEAYTYDALNRPVTAYDGRYYTKYIYDVMGNVTKSVSGLSSPSTNISSYAPTNASYSVVNYTYDKFGNMLTKTDAIGTTTYTYDFSGRQLTMKDGKGVTTTNTYSPTGLLLKSNAGGDLITNTYDFWGNLKTSKRGSDAATSYTYDNMFNMVKETQGTTVKDYTYDGLGNLMNFKLTYGNKTLQDADYTYDAMGRMATVSDGTDSVTYTYNPNGSVTEQANGNIKTYYEYNKAGLLTSLSNKREVTSKNGNVTITDLSTFTYTHRTDGNISTMADARKGETTQSNRYSYLNNGALSYAYLGSDTYYYGTNNRGNRTSSYMKDSDGVYHRTYNTYTTGNRISSAYSYDSTDTSARYDVTSYAYDANGNTLKATVDGVAKTKTYSNRNETKTYADGTNTASYTYGADGLRTSKTVNGTKTTYIWSGGNIVAEITGDKYVTYLYGLNRISRSITGPKYVGTHYEYDDYGEIISQTDIDGYHELYLYDGHGNVVQTVNEDIVDYLTDTQWWKTGEDIAEEVDVDNDDLVDLNDLQHFLNTYPIIQSYHYDAFGNQLDDEQANNTNPFRYCGEYWDKETGEIYLRARYYNPATGRFTTVDPAMDGTNWYVYCYGNPIAFVDPWGLKPGDEFESADDAAKDFAKYYNRESIENNREYGSVIYKVVEYGEKTETRGFWIFKYEVTVEDKSVIVEEYYTYSEAKKGRRSSVGTSNAPKGTTEVAQIHTHGAYTEVRNENDQIISHELDGFSDEDIEIAKEREVDTYVVTPWGNLYKATHENDYDDKRDIFDTGYASDPKIPDEYK